MSAEPYGHSQLDTEGPGSSVIVPRQPPGSTVPASFAQSRLWYIDQWQPNSPLYNVADAYRLKGPLDVDILNRCLTEIARRHEVLRTRFVAPEGLPLQVIEPPSPIASTLRDLSAEPRAEVEARLQALITAEVHRPFRLDELPLWRSLLIRLAPDEHVWVLTIHHIIYDAWSGQILHRELAALYRAFSQGQPSPLPELGIQYADFSVWQRKQAHSPLFREQLEFWRSRLSGAPALLELPADRPRPSEMTTSGATVRTELPAELDAALTSFSRAQRVTPFVTLLAAFAATLYRISGQSDLVIAAPVANRTQVEIEPLLGFFVNTLALRIDVSGRPSFRRLVERVRDVVFDALDHQDLPFERLVEELQPQRALTHTPIFQVLFQLNEIGRVPLLFDDISVEETPFDYGVARMDLAVTLNRSSAGLRGFAIYNSDLFDAATIQSQLAAFAALLEKALANPDCPVEQLPLLAPADRQRVLVDWNRTQEAYPADLCLHQLFERQAQSRPTACAVSDQAGELTYDQLNRRANALARQLLQRGVGPEVPVALLVDNSAAAVVAILAVLKAGGAYVPLDPTAPDERLGLIIRDSGARLALAVPALAPRLRASGLQCLLVQHHDPAPPGDWAENPSTGVTPDNLAYIIYTSGSTGTPRGVQIAHRGLVNLIHFDLRAFRIGSSAHVLQPLAISFDAATMQIFNALGGGGCVYMPDAETLLSPPALLQYVSQNKVSHTTFVVSMMMALPYAHLPDFCDVAVGGEAVPPELVARWIKGRRLYNVYGPTETSILTVWAPCAVDAQKPPIGRPIANCFAYVLDRNLQPMPVGVVGELCLGGVAVARGYLNQPALTAERFVPDPFCGEPGARMYRTGDLVRFLPDGNIDFVGRRDFQVKVRGFRVELGEIESALRQHPAVAEAVVQTYDAPGSQHQLAAYVVLKADRTVSVADLMEHLSRKVPPYMLPTSLTVLPAMPLTSAGKLDRRALPAPARPVGVGTLIEPTTAMERLVAAVWCRALGLEKVSVRDNFFDLGGHSLLAMQVIAQVHQQTGIQLSPREMVLGTLAQVAAALERSAKTTTPEPGPSAPSPVAAAGRLSGLVDRLLRRWRGGQ